MKRILVVSGMAVILWLPSQAAAQSEPVERDERGLETIVVTEAHTTDLRRAGGEDAAAKQARKALTLLYLSLKGQCGSGGCPVNLTRLK